MFCAGFGISRHAGTRIHTRIKLDLKNPYNQPLKWLSGFEFPSLRQFWDSVDTEVQLLFPTVRAAPNREKLSVFRPISFQIPPILGVAANPLDSLRSRNDMTLSRS